MKTKTLAIVHTAIFLSLSIILSYFKLPIFPYAPFLTLDLGLLPILLIGSITSYKQSLAMLFLRLVIMLLFQGFNLPNLIGYCSDTCFGLILLTLMYFNKKNKVIKSVFNIIASSLLMTVLNGIIFFPLYKKLLQIPLEGILLWTAILPFNLIKASLLLVLNTLIVKRLRKHRTIHQ